MIANPRAWGHGPRFAIPPIGIGRIGLVALIAASFAASLAACASPVVAPGGSSNPGKPDATPLDRIHQQASDALVRWADAVRKSGGATITFTGELTSQIGNWEPAIGDNNKVALLAGDVRSATDLPTDKPSRGQVKWLDGTTVDVNVLSAAAALSALVEAATDNCADCTPISVTDAKLATSLVETSRGPAEAPTWVYSVAGSNVRITRVAVDESVTVVPPPWNADDAPVGLSITSAKGSADSRKLTVSFVGAPKDASQRCGEDYTTEAVESELAIVVIVIEHRNPEPGACTLEGALRTAEVRLASKLGTRMVLEVKQGLPVPVVAP